MPAAIPTGRDRTFDLLRGGAVLYIVGYYHIQEIWLVGIPSAMAGWLARVALALFCFLSGYLLSNGTKIDSWRSVGRFYGRRLLKIYPLYLAALAAFVGMGLSPVALFWPSALLINTLWNWSLLTLWFISMIFLFYLILPLYLFRPNGRKTLGLTTLFLSLLVLAEVFGKGTDPRLFPNLVAFALGILVTQSECLRAAFFRPSPNVKSIALFTLLFLASLQWRTMPIDAESAHKVFVIGWFLASLPWLLIASRWLTRFLPACGVDFLATASFLLYLSHRIVYHLGEEIWSAPTPLLRQIYHLAILLPIALVLSYYGQLAWQRVK